MRLRFKLRWAMLLVAAVAVLIGPGYRYYGVLRDRSARYRAMARTAALDARLNFSMSRDPAYDEESRWRARTVAEWYLKRRDLYERAASFPFITVEVEWEPWATVPYRLVDGGVYKRSDPALSWPRNEAERKRQIARIREVLEGRPK